jgi:septal ring-binding cell division protein DamX
MGAKQKILVFILVLAIVISFFLGWYLVVKKHDFSSEEFAKDQTTTKIGDLFALREKKSLSDYDELLIKYKELKNKRLALDDEISNVEQQMLKLNKSAPVGDQNTSSAKEKVTKDIVILKDDQSKADNQTKSDNKINSIIEFNKIDKQINSAAQSVYAQPGSSGSILTSSSLIKPVSSAITTSIVSSAATESARQIPQSSEDISGNALAPAPVTSLFTHDQKTTKVVPVGNNTFAIAKNNKVVIISPKKKHQKSIEEKTVEPTSTSEVASNVSPEEKATTTKVDNGNLLITSKTVGNADVLTISKESTAVESSAKTPVVEEAKPLPPPQPEKAKVVEPSTKSAVQSETAEHTTTLPASSTKSKYYVVQLMSDSSSKNIVNFIHKNNLQGKAVCLKTKLNGKDWYILAYGNYNSRSQAASVIKTLPSNLKSQHPWIKPIEPGEASQVAG